MAHQMIAAVRAGVLRDARGREIPMSGEHECLFCREYVTEGRDMAGASRPFDPCWQVNGDFGCDASPDSGKDGCGDHFTLWDAALLTLKPEGYNAKR